MFSTTLSNLTIGELCLLAFAAWVAKIVAKPWIEACASASLVSISSLKLILFNVEQTSVSGAVQHKKEMVPPAPATLDTPCELEKTTESKQKVCSVRYVPSRFPALPLPQPSSQCAPVDRLPPSRAMAQPHPAIVQHFHFDSRVQPLPEAYAVKEDQRPWLLQHIDYVWVPDRRESIRRSH
jgi:hypothetical protein